MHAVVKACPNQDELIGIRKQMFKLVNIIFTKMEKWDYINPIDDTYNITFLQQIVIECEHKKVPSTLR